ARGALDRVPDRPARSRDPRLVAGDVGAADRAASAWCAGGARPAPRPTGAAGGGPRRAGPPRGQRGVTPRTKTVSAPLHPHARRHQDATHAAPVLQLGVSLREGVVGRIQSLSLALRRTTPSRKE